MRYLGKLDGVGRDKAEFRQALAGSQLVETQTDLGLTDSSIAASLHHPTP